MLNRFRNIINKRNLLLECPICHTALPITKEQLDMTITRCKACRNHFEYSDQLRAAGLPVPTKDNADFFPIRKGLDMRKSEEQLEILLRAKDLSKSDPIGNIIFAYFGIFFLAYSFFQTNGIDVIFVVLLMIPFLYLGIKSLLEGLVLWFNVTQITVHKEMISVEHAPINFLAYKDRHLMAHAIEQLSIQKYEVDKTFENHDRQGQTLKYDWKIIVKMKDGEEVSLIHGLSFEEDAKLLEQHIEKYLGIREELELKDLPDREAIKIQMPDSHDNPTQNK